MDEYPNSSETFNEDQQWQPEKPEDRQEVEQQEQSKITTSLPVIEEILAWFDKNAGLYESVDSLGVNEETSSDQAKLAILLSKKMRAAFQDKSAQFRRDFAKYLEEVQPNG